MAILAHPDDESLGMGGTLAKYASEGVGTSLLTATRGEAGRYRGHRDGPEHPGALALGRVREAELRAAASALGIRQVTLLDYNDQQLDRADPREAIARIAGELRRVRPDVVATFGPDGAYGHPDHVAIGQFTTAAVAAAAFAAGVDADAPAHLVKKLYYIAWAAPLWATYEDVFKKLTSHVDGIDRQAVPWPDWAITTVIDTEAFWPAVWRAVSCHDSQMVGFEKLKTLDPGQHQALWGRQSFYRALSMVNGGRTRENDLFEGLR